MNYRDSGWLFAGLLAGFSIAISLVFAWGNVYLQSAGNILDNINVEAVNFDFNETELVEAMVKNIPNETQHFNKYNYTQNECKYSNGEYFDGWCYFK